MMRLLSGLFILFLAGCSSAMRVVDAQLNPDGWAMQMDPGRDYKGSSYNAAVPEPLDDCPTALTHVYLVNETSPYDGTVLHAPAHASVETGGEVRALMVPRRPDTLRLAVERTGCGERAIQVVMRHNAARVTYQVDIPYHHLDTSPADDVPATGRAIQILRAPVPGSLRAEHDGRPDTAVAIMGCRLEVGRCHPLGLAAASDARRLVAALQEAHDRDEAARRAAEYEADRKRREAEHAALLQAQQQLWREATAPAPRILQAPCTQATTEGPRFPPGSLLDDDARQILLVQPEGASPAQLKRVAAANYGKCVFVEGATVRPETFAPVAEPPFVMHIQTRLRHYRVYFAPSQYREYLAWNVVGQCNEGALATVAGAFAGLVPGGQVFGVPDTEYIMELEPARLIALQDWDGDRVFPRDTWTQMSVEELQAILKACRGS